MCIHIKMQKKCDIACQERDASMLSLAVTRQELTCSSVLLWLVLWSLFPTTCPYQVSCVTLYQSHNLYGLYSSCLQSKDKNIYFTGSRKALQWCLGNTKYCSYCHCYYWGFCLFLEVERTRGMCRPLQSHGDFGSANSYQSTRWLINNKGEEIAIYGCLRHMIELAISEIFLPPWILLMSPFDALFLFWM